MERRALLLSLLMPALVAGCGGSKPAPTRSSASAGVSTATTTRTPPAPTKTTTSASPTAPPLQGEAASAAAGDIPDNQVFLVFRNGSAGYSIKYPEGWAQRGSGRNVVFRDKNNIVRVVVATGSPPTLASVRRELTGRADVKVTTQPQTATISGQRVVKVVYRTESGPNSVTGKRVTLTVDRYYLLHGRKVAVIDLGTPVGVDNVDAYRLMIESFRWR